MGRGRAKVAFGPKLRYKRGTMSIFRTLSVAVTAGLLALAASAQTHPAATTAGADSFSGEAYIIEDLKSLYRFESDGTGQREVIGRVHVQSEAGIQQWGQLVVGYSADNERVEFRYVRVKKADGTVVQAPTDAVQDLTGPVAREAPVYTDFHQKHLSVPGLRPGDTLEYDVVTVITKSVAPNQFWMSHDFDQSSIVLNEEVEVNIPKSRKVTLKAKPEFESKVRDEGDRKIYHWASQHLEREDDDKNLTEKEKRKKRKKKVKDSQTPAVQMTTFASWEQVGEWYESLETGRRTPSPEMKAKADQLIAGKTTDIEKIEALYDFVGPNFRYVSLSLGLGRYQPHAASEVFANQYGDCKDKHTLLAGMLEAIGFHASSVLINSSRKLDPDVPSPAQFDHVISMLPLNGQEVWMDTTAEIAPFRLLAFQLRDKQALLVPPDGKGKLVTTPADPPFPNVQLQEIDGKIGDLGKLTARVHFTMKGDGELLFRSIFRRVPNAQWNKVLESLNTLAGLDGDLTDVKVTDPASTHVPFEMTYTIAKVNYLDWTRKNAEMPLPLTQFISLQEVDDDDSPEAEPVKLGPPGDYIYRVKIELPPNYKARLPVPFTLKRDYAEYAADYKLDGATMTGERHLIVRQKEIPATRVRDYQTFRRALESDLSQQVAMETSTAGATGAAGGLKADDLDQAGYEALQSGNLTVALDLLKRATETDPKHATAWIHLGRAYLALRQYDNGIAAFQKQLEVNPYDEFANNELGRTYWLQRKYDQAAAAFHKQLEQNPLDKYAHGALGSMYAEWKKYDLAAPELEKAISLNPDEPSYQTALGDAYLNLGQDDKSLAAFDRAIELSPTPETWNNIAYQLSLKKAHLDKAQQYAESAVSATAAALRNVTLGKVTLRELALVNSLSAYWDTLGWVFYVKGDLDKAQRYIQGSWDISARGEVGDHLGQLYEARGDKAKAAEWYALALKADRPELDTMDRLKKLVGEKEAEKMASAAVQKMQDLRTYKLKPAAKSASGEVWVLIGPGGVTEDLRFIKGGDELKPLEPQIRGNQFRMAFPEDSPARVVRRGVVVCGEPGGCQLVLEPLETTRPD